MTLLFSLLQPDEFPAEPDHLLYPKGRNAEQVHCLCGRFAKYLGGHNYYNGWFDCYSFDVECKRCGIVTVECV